MAQITQRTAVSHTTNKVTMAGSTTETTLDKEWENYFGEDESMVNVDADKLKDSLFPTLASGTQSTS